MGLAKLLGAPLWIDRVQKAMRGIVVEDRGVHCCLTEPHDIK